jgi:DNA end-binding protein Ku
MARQLIESMSDEWKPSDFKDEFRERLQAVIEERMKSKGLVSHVDRDKDGDNETATTNVVDFMTLLQKSLASNKRTPAAKSAKKAAPAKKAAAKKSVAKKSNTTAKKTAPKPVPRRKSA